MIGDWYDEWNLKRHWSYRSVNRHDSGRGVGYLNRVKGSFELPLPTPPAIAFRVGVPLDAIGLLMLMISTSNRIHVQGTYLT